MRRTLLLLPLALALAAPAQAGIFTVLKGAAKLGSLAGKAGKTAKLAKLGKGAALLKGAGKVSAVVAAERVFAQAARHADAIPIYVTRADDLGGLKVVMEGGDELAHTPGSLQRFTAELDTMADASEAARVDVYVDASAAGDVADLALGPNTRLWLANVDGPSLPMRAAADGAPEVRVAGDLWFRLGTEALEQVVGFAPQLADAQVTYAGPCGHDAPLDAASGAGTLVVLDDLDPSEHALWRAEAEARGIDLVVLGLEGVCDGDRPLAEAAATAEAARRAATLGDLWALAGSGVPPTARWTGDALTLEAGPHLMAFHPLGDDAVAAAPEPEDPYAPLKGFLVLVGLLGAGWAWKRFQAPAVTDGR